MCQSVPNNHTKSQRLSNAAATQILNISHSKKEEKPKKTKPQTEHCYGHKESLS